MGDSLQESLNSLNNKTRKKTENFYLPPPPNAQVSTFCVSWRHRPTSTTLATEWKLSPTVADLIHNADADATKVGSFVASSVW